MNNKRMKKKGQVVHVVRRIDRRSRWGTPASISISMHRDYPNLGGQGLHTSGTYELYPYDEEYRSILAWAKSRGIEVRFWNKDGMFGRTIRAHEGGAVMEVQT